MIKGILWGTFPDVLLNFLFRLQNRLLSTNKKLQKPIESAVRVFTVLVDTCPLSQMTLEFLQNDFQNKTYSSTLFQKYKVKPQLVSWGERCMSFSDPSLNNFIRTNVRDGLASIRKLEAALTK